MSDKTEFKVMSIEDIKKKVETGYEVELSGFCCDEDPEDAFPCVLKKVDLLAYHIHGNVPNELATYVEQLFDASNKKDAEVEMASLKKVEEYTRFCEWLAEESLVEPKFSDLEEAGIYLNQVQLTEIYTFQMQGVKALKSFRDFNRDASAGIDLEAVLSASVSDDGDRG